MNVTGPDAATYIALALAVPATIVGLYKWAFGRQMVEMSYAIKRTSILDGNRLGLPNAFQVTFNNVEVESLDKFEVIIWNSGISSIKEGDIVRTSPLILTIPDDTLLYNISISRTTDIDTNCRLLVSESGTYQIWFDFLDQDYGLAIEILTSRSIATPKVTGKIVNTRGKIYEKKFDETSLTKRDKRITFLFGMVIAFVPVLGMVGAYLFSPDNIGKWVNYLFTYTMFIAVGIGLMFMLRSMLTNALNLKKELPPIELKDNEKPNIWIP